MSQPGITPCSALFLTIFSSLSCSAFSWLLILLVVMVNPGLIQKINNFAKEPVSTLGNKKLRSRSDFDPDDKIKTLVRM